jgi:hypothetical protein
MLRILLTVGMACAVGAAAQDAAKPALTAADVIEKSIAASGGRAAMEKVTSTMFTGMMGTSPDEMHSMVTYYAKAPNKRLVVMNLEGVGEIRQGFDGTVGWNQMPGQEASEVTGEFLDEVRREAIFNAPLKWRELYSKAELKGKEKVGEREAYVVVLSPENDKPLTQYYDAETFLLLRQSGMYATPQGQMYIRAELSDYRDIGGGLKAPFERKQVMPVGEINMRITVLKNNVEIDDAMFAKPVAAAKAK